MGMLVVAEGVAVAVVAVVAAASQPKGKTNDELPEPWDRA